MTIYVVRCYQSGVCVDTFDGERIIKEKPIVTFEDFKAYLGTLDNNNQLMFSSTMDFPEDETDDPRTLKLVADIQAYLPPD